MDVSRFLEKPLTAKPGETLGRAVAAMIRERKHEILVFDGKRFLGLVVARDLIKRRADPDSTKIDFFMKKIYPLMPETPLEEITAKMLINDYKTLPFWKPDGGVMVLSKIGLLKTIKDNEVFRGKRAEDVMKFPYCISMDDSIATARSLIRELNISRIPVVNERDGVEGVADTLDLLRAVVVKEKMRFGDRVWEKRRLEGIPVSSFMQKNFPRAGAEASLQGVMKMMIKKESAVVIEENGKIKGMVSPKDILKLVGFERRGVYVTISGIGGEDEFIRSVVDEEISNFVRKVSKMLRVNHFVIHVDRYHRTGSRTKYSVHTRLSTEKGVFFAKDFGWDLTKAVRGIIHKLERELIRRKEKYPRG